MKDGLGSVMLSLRLRCLSPVLLVRTRILERSSLKVCTYKTLKVCRFRTGTNSSRDVTPHDAPTLPVLRVSQAVSPLSFSQLDADATPTPYALW